MSLYQVFYSPVKLVHRRFATCNAPNSTTGYFQKTERFIVGWRIICPKVISDKQSSASRRLRDLSFLDLKASENPCALYCMSETNLVTSLRPKVVDGTTCYRGIRDICVGGVCMEIPCDLDMKSAAVEDVCGVCRGDSTSCTLKQGTMSFMAQARKKERT